MNPYVLVTMAALLTAWIGIGVPVVAYGTPLGVAFYVLAIVATNPRVWRCAEAGVIFIDKNGDRLGVRRRKKIILENADFG